MSGTPHIDTFQSNSGNAVFNPSGYDDVTTILMYPFDGYGFAFKMAKDGYNAYSAAGALLATSVASTYVTITKDSSVFPGFKSAIFYITNE